MDNKKINKFIMVMNAIGIKLNPIYAEVIFKTALMLDTITVNNIADLHNQVVDQRVTQARKLITEKVKESIKEDLNTDTVTQEIAELFIGDVKV